LGLGLESIELRERKLRETIENLQEATQFQELMVNILAGEERIALFLTCKPDFLIY
jgi:hypothetical protein